MAVARLRCRLWRRLRCRACVAAGGYRGGVWNSLSSSMGTGFLVKRCSQLLVLAIQRELPGFDAKVERSVGISRRKVRDPLEAPGLWRQGGGRRVRFEKDWAPALRKKRLVRYHTKPNSTPALPRARWISCFSCAATSPLRRPSSLSRSLLVFAVPPPFRRPSSLSRSLLPFAVPLPFRGLSSLSRSLLPIAERTSVR